MLRDMTLTESWNVSEVFHHGPKRHYPKGGRIPRGGAPLVAIVQLRQQQRLPRECQHGILVSMAPASRLSTSLVADACDIRNGYLDKKSTSSLKDPASQRGGSEVILHPCDCF